ncbi:hypothetical protein SGCOL_000934 [Colletotrichum sp. CLE4]
MNASVQRDRPSQGKRYTLNHTQERAWSTAYRRRPSAEETTVVISWHLSSCCYSLSDEDMNSGRDGCIRQAPGTPFDLESIMEDVAYAIGGYSMYSSRRGQFSALESQDIDLSNAPTIISSKTALITYIVFTLVTACLWFWHFFVGMIPDAPNCDRFLTVSLTLTGAALIAASIRTTRTAFEADDILREYESVFEYHNAGISMLVVTWIASASHLLSVAAYIAAVAVGERLQKPDQYPPESEPSDMGSMIDERRVREVEMPTEAERDEHYRRRLEEFVRVRDQRRRAEAAPSRLDRIREESLVNHADDDGGLPSYSRIDPYAMHAPVKPNAATGPPIEMTDLRTAASGQSREDNVDVPAPDYEQHQTASSRRP